MAAVELQCLGIFRGYVGIMEKNMETTIAYWGSSFLSWHLASDCCRFLILGSAAAQSQSVSVVQEPACSDALRLHDLLQLLAFYSTRWRKEKHNQDK